MIDEAEVRRIAGLAKLELDDDATARMASDLSLIIDYVETLGELEVPSEAAGDTRQLELLPDSEDDTRVDRERLAEIAPAIEQGFIVVPPVIG